MRIFHFALKSQPANHRNNFGEWFLSPKSLGICSFSSKMFDTANRGTMRILRTVFCRRCHVFGFRSITGTGITGTEIPIRNLSL